MKHEEKHEEGRRIIPLCSAHGCCPTAELTADGVILRDDHEGVVRLTRDEWLRFLAKVKRGELG
jgi:hypothetical protein